MNIFIGCCKKKMDFPCKSIDMYNSTLFKYCYNYSLDKGNVYILSAKYGLLKTDNIISPYDKTLKSMDKNEIKKWYDNVKLQMIENGIDKNEEAMFLCGKLYYEGLLDYFSGNISIPLEGMSIGQRLHFLKEKNNEKKYR